MVIAISPNTIPSTFAYDVSLVEDAIGSADLCTSLRSERRLRYFSGSEWLQLVIVEVFLVETGNAYYFANDNIERERRCVVLGLHFYSFFNLFGRIVRLLFFWLVEHFRVLLQHHLC